MVDDGASEEPHPRVVVPTDDQARVPTDDVGDCLEAAHRKDPVNAPAPPRSFNWHGLRHFAISTWIEAGLAPKTVQTFAGHASLAITMDRYGHLFPSEDHRKAMDAIAKGLFS